MTKISGEVPGDKHKIHINLPLRKIILVCCTIFLLILLGAGVVTLINQPRTMQSDDMLNVVASNFPAYDFARAVLGGSLNSNNTDVAPVASSTNNSDPAPATSVINAPDPAPATSDFAAHGLLPAQLTMLTAPGAELHDYEPTPADIISIKNADLFIYNGGESDAWVEELLESNEIPATNTLRLMDFVAVKAEDDGNILKPEESEQSEESGESEESEEPEGAAESDNASGSSNINNDYDEHIWTSIPNAIKLINAISDKLSQIASKNHHDSAEAQSGDLEPATFYQENAARYVKTLSDIDSKIRQVVASAPRRELIFADRFPFRYFTDEYGLSYVAAFPGCAEDTEASSGTVARLIDYVKDSSAPVILKLELSSGSLADTIAEETGAKVLTLHSAHNVTKADFDSGLSYTDIMEQNINVLKEALQ